MKKNLCILLLIGFFLSGCDTDKKNSDYIDDADYETEDYENADYETEDYETEDYETEDYETEDYETEDYENTVYITKQGETENKQITVTKENLGKEYENENDIIEAEKNYDFFHLTYQDIYKDSLTYLVRDAFYDEKNDMFHIIGILYNDRPERIAHVRFETDTSILINGEEFTMRQMFRLPFEIYPYLERNQGITLILSTKNKKIKEATAHDRSIRYTADQIKINLKYIRFEPIKD